MERYLGFMLCVLVTVFTLAVVGFGIYVGWTGLIEPIMDRIKKQRDTYWEDKYHEEFDENVKLKIKINKFGLDDSFINCIRHPYKPMIDKVYYDTTPLGNRVVNVTVKFIMDVEPWVENFGEVKNDADNN